MKKWNVLIAAAVLTGLAASAPTVEGQQGKMHHGHGHGAMHGATSNAGASPSSKAFAEANAKMHDAMNIAYSGDADVDFVKGMIPHHQGAIDMARIVLEHGRDPEIRKLAEEIIKAQEAEIAHMEAWLKKRGG